MMNEIDKLRNEARAKLDEADRIQKLYERYPDLRKYVGRWEKVAYCSKSINAEVTNFDSRYNCGCCADSPLEIWSYKETELGRVYSDPTGIMVANRSDGDDIPYSGWESRFRSEGFTEAFIDRVRVRVGVEEESVDTGADDGYG